MKLLGVHMGYDEPFWYFGRWEFLLHDRGWTLAHRRIIKLDGYWPRYSTFHRRRSRQ